MMYDMIRISHELSNEKQLISSCIRNCMRTGWRCGRIDIQTNVDFISVILLLYIHLHRVLDVCINPFFDPGVRGVSDVAHINVACKFQIASRARIKLPSCREIDGGRNRELINATGRGLATM